MSLLLTVYNTPSWKIFVHSSGLQLIDEIAPLVDSNIAILQSTQSLQTLSALLSGLSSGQTLWLGAVQAEYFLATMLENGSALTEAAQTWEQLTNGLLALQRQQRKKLQLFNLHQALAQPDQFRLLLSPDVKINEYSEYQSNSNLPLLAASQYLTQHPELQALNTRLQASVLPLCDSEKLTLNIDQILLQSYTTAAAASSRDALQSELRQTQEQLELHTAQLANISAERDSIQSQLQQAQEQLESNLIASATKLASMNVERDYAQQKLEKITTDYNVEQQARAQFELNLRTTGEERDLILAQLHQVQEQLEQYCISLETEQQNNKHTLLARDKQYARDTTKLEGELRKIKAKAANAEYAGQLLQQELDKLRKSISWKAATPVRILGRLVRKDDPTRVKLLQDIGLLLTSEYFDVDWYLRAYPDVADNQINPAEHYLLHGAAEGRLPGPSFDGNWYLQHYPDVAAANINPLLHFILYGQQEGRSSSPILLTNNSQDTEE